jgi:hypothetical protein
MGAPRRVMAVAADWLLAATTVTAVAAQDNRPEPPNEVVAAAWAAADEARAAAQALATAAEDDDAGDPQGFGTEAFQRRHADLAARHKDRPGNAWRVHQALASGESPAGLGQQQAAAASAAWAMHGRPLKVTRRTSGSWPGP